MKIEECAVTIQGEESVYLPPFVVNDWNPVLPQSQTIDWWYNKLGISAIHSLGITGKGIKVAVIDTLCKPDHPDMAGAVVKSINVTAEAITVPQNGHGQGVAGCIGARNNETGVIGAAPSCQIVAIKAMRESGSGLTSEIVKGIDAAIAEGCHIINMSLGTTADDPAMRDAVKRATDKGILVVCAAGNAGQADSVNYPAKYPLAIAIAATNSSGNVSSFSSQGWDVDIAAPGERILTCWKDNTYATVSGTSFSSPITAGILALFLEAKMQVTQERLYATAIDIGESGRDTSAGYGLINPNGYFTAYSGPSPSATPSPSSSSSVSESRSESPSSSASKSASSSKSESPSESRSTSPSPSESPNQKIKEAKTKAEEVVKILGEVVGL